MSVCQSPFYQIFKCVIYLNIPSGQSSAKLPVTRSLSHGHSVTRTTHAGLTLLHYRDASHLKTILVFLFPFLIAMHRCHVCIAYIFYYYCLAPAEQYC